MVKPEDLVVMKNEEALFHCQFTAEPLPIVEWYHENELVANKSRYYILIQFASNYKNFLYYFKKLHVLKIHATLET